VMDVTEILETLCYASAQEVFRMATQAVQPRAEICAEKQRLGDAFLRAVQEIMQLQDLQIVSVTNDGEGLARFKLALELARTKRDVAKDAYLLHIKEHECYAAC
jgi:hypothetical protein